MYATPRPFRDEQKRHSSVPNRCQLLRANFLLFSLTPRPPTIFDNGCVGAKQRFPLNFHPHVSPPIIITASYLPQHFACFPYTFLQQLLRRARSNSAVIDRLSPFVKKFSTKFQKTKHFSIVFFILSVDCCSLIQNFYKTFPSTTYCTVLSFIRRINKIQQFNETTMKKIITVQAFI